MNIQNKRHSTGNLHLVNNKLTDNKYMKKNEDLSLKVLVNSNKKTEDEKVKIVDTSWELFKQIEQLGKGSFGSVCRVECLEST